MNRSVLTFLLCLATVPAMAGDLPVMQLLEPGGPPQKYAQSSNMLVLGTVTPPIESNVRIQLYEVREGDRLFMLTGTDDIKLDSKGQFMSSLLPSAKGWPVGQMRVVVTLTGLRQVKKWTTVEIVKLNDIPDEEFETKMLEVSDVIVDAERPDDSYQIAGKHTFLIRGRFVKKEGLRGNQGPLVHAKIVLPASNRNPEIIYQSTTAISLPEGAPDHFWYEILIDAPEKPENYKLRINQNWGRPGEPQAPPKQPKDGFNLQVGFGPDKK